MKYNKEEYIKKKRKYGKILGLTGICVVVFLCVISCFVAGRKRTLTKQLSQKYFTLTQDDEQTLQDTIEQVISLSKQEDVRAIIELEDGVYSMKEPLVIDGAAYGSHELELVIKNAEGAAPVLSGNLDLQASDFQKVEGKEYYSYQLPDAAKDGEEWPEFRDLYLNGERLQLARGKEYTFKRNPKDQEIKNNQIKGYSNWFYVDSEPFREITNENLSTLELCFKVEWMNKIYRIAQLHSIDNEYGLMQLSVRNTEWSAYLKGDGNKRDFTDRNYWFMNHITLLDEPGEFYYDHNSGVIYLYPYKDTDMANAVVSYPVVERLVDLKNVSGITFQGLRFTGTTSNQANQYGYNGELGGTYLGSDHFQDGCIQVAAIYGEGTENITIKECVFDELGTHGIFLNEKTKRVTIQGNSFTNMAMSAVTLGKHEETWNEETGLSDVLIDNNYIYNIGTEYLGCPGIHIARVKNLKITHNTVMHTPYSGVVVGWFPWPSDKDDSGVGIMNAEVAYNHCEDNLYALNDGGGLYFCGINAPIEDTKIYNYIHDNYIKSTGYDMTYDGIYLDINSSNYKVHHNVIEGYKTSLGPIFFQDHVKEQYSHNIFVENNYSTVSRIHATATPERNIQLIDNQFYLSSTDLPKEAKDIVENAGVQEEYKKHIVEKHTMIKMKVEEPHISVKRNGFSSANSVVFTITNHDTKTASYSLVHTNPISGGPTMLPSEDVMTLKAGETGKISVIFLGGDKRAEASQIDIAVVKDNGWKMQFSRVIEVAVSAAVAVDEGEEWN